MLNNSTDKEHGEAIIILISEYVKYLYDSE